MEKKWYCRGSEPTQAWGPPAPEPLLCTVPVSWPREGSKACSRTSPSGAAVVRSEDPEKGWCFWRAATARKNLPSGFTVLGLMCPVLL